MSEYTKYLENVYSDESIPDHLSDVEEIQCLIADEGYQEWSEELERTLDEQSAWKGSLDFSGILIKKQCEHQTCSHFKCERSLRIGGIEI